MFESANTSVQYSQQFRTFEFDDLNMNAIDFSDIDFTLNEQTNSNQNLKRKTHLNECEKTLKKFCALPVTSEQFTQFTKDTAKHFKITCSMIKKSPCFGQDTNNNIIAQPSSVDLFIQNASLNTPKFLGYGQETLSGKSFKTLFKSSEMSKLESLVQNISEQVTVKPFHALMNSKINEHEDHMEMIVWPIVKKFNKNIFVELFVQKLDDFQSHVTDSDKNCVNKKNSCDMDKIITLIDLEGFIISLDLSNFRSKLNKNEQEVVRDHSFSKKNVGLLNDFSIEEKNKKPRAKLIDYVHSNDMCHLQKHLKEVIEKGEVLNSSIYRLKISDKFAFVQSSSKIIKKDCENERDKYHKSYIHTIHSIIKEIDSEIEMKGKASTSLMKTLISRKPSASLVISNEENSENSNSTIFSQRQKSQSSDVQPLTPIGTKFALTMLGLSKNQNSAHKTIKNSASNSSIRTNECSNEAQDCKQLIDQDDLDSLSPDRIEKNRLKLNFIKKKSIEDNVAVIRHPIDPNSSFKQLIKKEIAALEERKTNNVDLNKNQTKSKSNAKVKEHQQTNEDTLEKSNKTNLNNNLLLKRLLSQENLMPIELNKFNEAATNENQLSKKKSNKVESENSSRDDIILRALLNSNDLEPQVLEIESVFKLGQCTNNSLNRQNSPKKNVKSESTKKDKNAQKNTSNNSSSICSDLKSFLKKDNIQLSDEIENNQVEVLKNKFERFIEQGSCGFSDQNQNLAVYTKHDSNQSIHLSKSCSNLSFENISEPGSIKSEPCITNCSKPVQYTSALNEDSENSQTKQQITSDDLQKQKRIEAITKQLKSGLIESFKTSIVSDDQFKPNNQVCNSTEISSLGVDFSFGNQDPDLGAVESEFVLNKVSNATQSNYQTHYSTNDGQYTCNIQKSYYQSNTQTNSVHSDQSKEPINQQSSAETNSTVLRKKLQERLNQKKSNAHSTPSNIDSKNFQSSSTTFSKNQFSNIAIVSPVVSNQHYAQTDLDAKTNKIDAEPKSASLNMYRKTMDNEYKTPQQPSNTNYNYSVMPTTDSYSYTTPNKQTMTTTVTVTTKHYPHQINSPSYPSVVKQQENVQGYPSSLYTASKIPPIYDQNDSVVYTPVENSNCVSNELYFEPKSQAANYSNYQNEETAPNIEINTKINVNFQMADAYAQKNPSKYPYQTANSTMINRTNNYMSNYDNYKKMASSYPVYEQPVFSDQPSLSTYQQNQYLRQSYESVCVSRAQPTKQFDMSYGNVYGKNELSVKDIGQVHTSDDLSTINTEMCDFQNFEEEAFNENMYFLQNLLID